MAFFSETETENDTEEPVLRRDGMMPGVSKALLGLAGVLIVASVPYLFGDDDCIELSRLGEASRSTRELDALVAPEAAPVGREGLEVCARNFQVWVSGDPIPFSTHFRTDSVLPGSVHTQDELKDQAGWEGSAISPPPSA